MALAKGIIQLPGHSRKVDLTDLASILQKNLNDNNLQILDLIATNFTPLGQNFGSVMVKLDVSVQRSNSSKIEKLYLVAKTINSSERPIIHWPSSVRREVFIYAELLPAYRNLEREAGIPEDDLIDLIPKYYGHRFSINKNSNEIDEDSLFLMENMKMRGYYTENKETGIDKDHAGLLMIALARYHALGIALKQKKPEFFKKVVTLTQPEMLGADFQQLDEGFQGILKNFQDSECFKKYLSIIESTFADSLNGHRFTAPAVEPWTTVTHGDLWINNVLFHKDSSGNVDDVKLIDFQGYTCGSPLIDVTRFLLVSLNHGCINNFDELVDIYYSKFISSLKRLDCDFTSYSRSAFDEELKVQAVYSFPLCAMARKFSVYELKDERNSSELMTSIFQTGCTDSLIETYQELISIFEKKAWF